MSSHTSNNLVPEEIANTPMVTCEGCGATLRLLLDTEDGELIEAPEECRNCRDTAFRVPPGFMLRFCHSCFLPFAHPRVRGRPPNTCTRCR